MVNTRIKTFFAPFRTCKCSYFTSIAIFILRILRHSTCSCYKITSGSIFACRTLYSQIIAMLIPAACSQINGATEIAFTTACNDIDYTTCSIRTILRSTRAFDNFDFINSIHIGYFIDINTCRFRASFRAIT